jgi:hypothetical protein
VHAPDLADCEGDLVLAQTDLVQLLPELEEAPAGEHVVLADDDGGEHRPAVGDLVLADLAQHLADLRAEMPLSMSMPSIFASSP